MTAPAPRGPALPGRAARVRGRRLRRPGDGLGRRRSRPRATARSRSGSPTARCSGSARSTTASTSLGSRPAAELDPPVLAALRIAGYELAWSEAPATRSSTTRSSSSARPGLAHATGFTNAVARRLAEGFPALVAALPPGPLAESYPDWIYETWVRDWGEDEALAADARPERARRARRPLRRPGRRADRRAGRLPPRARQRSRARRTAAIWQSRGSQLAALALGSRDGERILDACAAPGAKATMLQRRGDRGRAPPRPRPRARGERPPPRRHERPRRQRRRPRARRVRLRPRARRRAVLGPRRARPPARPALARDRRCPGLQLELLHAAAERTRPRRHACSTRSAR